MDISFEKITRGIECHLFGVSKFLGYLDYNILNLINGLKSKGYKGIWVSKFLGYSVYRFPKLINGLNPKLINGFSKIQNFYPNIPKTSSPFS